MTRIFGRLIVVVAAAALVTPLAFQAPRVEASTPSTTGDQTVGSAAWLAAQAFRQQAGISSDAQTVTLSLADPVEYSNERFGVPLTDSEASEVALQMSAQTDLAPVAEAAAALSDFASAYFEGGVLHILVTGDSSAADASLSPIEPKAAEVEVGTALMSAAQLAALQDAIVKDARGLASLRVTLLKVAVNPRSARVEVTIAGGGDVVLASEVIAGRYGSGVDVLVDATTGALFACNSRYDCGTKGGLAAHNIWIGGVTCTTAFVVKDNTYSTRYLMTAGHCIQDAGGASNSYPWKNQAATLTWGTNVRYRNDVNFDEGIFRLGSTLPSVYNDYFASAPNGIMSITNAEMTYAAMPAGLWVCRSGRSSGYGCGTVHRANIDWYDGTYWHWGVWEVTQVSTYGDSGSGYVAFGAQDRVYPAGILFGGDTGLFPTYSYYSAAYDDWAIGVHACTSAAC